MTPAHKLSTKMMRSLFGRLWIARFLILCTAATHAEILAVDGGNPVPVIDIHTHVFNIRDLPLVELLDGWQLKRSRAYHSLRRIKTAMQRLELSLLTALPGKQRLLVPDGQPVVLEIEVAAALPHLETKSNPAERSAPSSKITGLR